MYACVHVFVRACVCMMVTCVHSSLLNKKGSSSSSRASPMPTTRWPNSISPCPPMVGAWIGLCRTFTTIRQHHHPGPSWTKRKYQPYLISTKVTHSRYISTHYASHSHSFFVFHDIPHSFLFCDILIDAYMIVQLLRMQTPWILKQVGA
jgi:hypothetical protein